MKTRQTIQEQLSSPDVVAMVKDWLQKNKQQGRRALARHLCQELDLNDSHTGKPRLAGVQKALRVLESQGYWKLPQYQAVPPEQWNPRRLDKTVPLPQGVPPSVEAVAGLHLVEVTSRDDALFRLWNELILTEHPLHDCRLVGRQLRYLIGSDHGWLGAIWLLCPSFESTGRMDRLARADTQGIPGTVDQYDSISDSPAGQMRKPCQPSPESLYGSNR